MVVSTSQSPPISGERLLTAADLAVLPFELPSGSVDYELDNGRLVIVVPPGNIHGAVQSNIGTQLKVQGEFRQLGKARSEVGIVLWRNPDRVVGADVAFIVASSLPIRETPEGYLETIPELVVEVRSKNDSPSAIQHKVEDYLKAGVLLVCVADAESRTITLHRPNQPPRELKDSDVLDLPDLIPDFRMPVADAFRE